MFSAKEVAGLIIRTAKKGSKVLICGNGGSAAESSHFVAELVCRFKHERQALPAISLNADTAVITAIANDYGYDHVFSRQIEALGRPGDLLITLSTSGTSPNIIKAKETAKANGLDILALATGETAETQENHLKRIHEICGIIDDHYRRQ